MKKHLSFFVLLALLICGNTAATAQLLLKDDFTDTVGTVLTAAGWSLSGTTVTNPITIVAGTGITFPGYASSGIGNAVAMKNTGQDVYKSFSTVNTGSVYLSFLLKVSAVLTGDYFIAVSPPAVQFNYYARLHLKSTTGGYLVGISKSNELAGGSQYGTTPFALDSTYLVVLKYTFVPAATPADTVNDPISVYVLPQGTSLTTEPTTPEINAYLNATRGDATDLGYVTLRQGSNTAAATLTIDGIRVGTTWADLNGSGPVLRPIKAARLAANATDVFFEGILTRAKGAFTYLQDTSAGIVVRQTSGAWFDSVTAGGLKAGDKVRVYGKTSEFNSLKQINGADFYSFTRISRSNSVPSAQLVNLRELATNGENYEAELVKVTSVLITGSGAFTAATTYAIKDPSDSTNAVALRIPNAADSDVDGRPIIALAMFTGVVGQFSSANPAAGYQLMAVDSTDLTDNVVSVQDVPSGIPAAYALYTNYPNPFNPSTTIKFGVPEASNVTLKIYDIVGREVATLMNDRVAAGYHNVSWNASDMASGVYLYRITATSVSGPKQSFTQVRKLVLMK